MRFMTATAAALAVLWTACAPTPRPLERHEYSRAAMGTEARVVLYAVDEPSARAGASIAFARIAALDRVMTDWAADSELSLLNGDAGGPARPVSPDLFDVLSRARDIAEASDGAFDPTVGPLVALWREARRNLALPDAAALASARALVGWKRLELVPAGPAGFHTARLATRGMRLDLGGIGKGFAAQEAVSALAMAGYPHALVAIAGDVAAGEPPPDRPGWEVSIGRDGGKSVLVTGAISTSGDAEQFVEVGGVRYSHIVDPRTGLGLTGSAWVTVKASDGATADALATAVSVLGKEKGRALVRRFPGAELVAFRKP
jgi:FAD:protein FMN transferase